MLQSAIDFCKAILSEVSRSFALTIPMLDKDIYKPVLITYLQDRLLDNFEDEIREDDITLAERKEMMDEVVKLFKPDNMKIEDSVSRISDYAYLMPEEGLKKLTTNAGKLRKAYDSLADGIKEISYKWLQEMNLGMQKYLTAEVRNFTELDEYCYYVAGTVGGFLTETILFKRELEEKKRNLLLAKYKSAGLFLQKINLIRDIKKDVENREKNFWPLKELRVSVDDLLNPTKETKAMQALRLMINDVKDHIPDLIDYYEALPDSLAGYKKFFAMNNALGLATLEVLDNNRKVLYGKKPVKVSKLRFFSIIKSPEKAFYKGSKLLTDNF
ncbi:squalene/phytoene synthase family protein [Iocasia frigidifontis]|uniref:Squalene/phytoene synthase family protein n=1 Tax=Iocasia fonsfrigidae TaxID=2682810 RepID=A0A8A7KAC5_9FIRM|nr:squalene/phytoene synthase family protein [Iocasia fonsfrigidae]